MSGMVFVTFFLLWRCECVSRFFCAFFMVLEFVLMSVLLHVVCFLRLDGVRCVVM